MLLGACQSSQPEARILGPAPTTNLEFSAARAAAANSLWRACCRRLYWVDYDAGERRDAGLIDPYGRYFESLPTSVQRHLAYDPALGAECLARLGSAAASCALSESAAEAIDRACFGYRGTLAPGDECTDSIECAAPDGGRVTCLRGSPAMTSPKGTCTVVGRGARGDLCDPFTEAGTVYFCDPAEGLYCGQSGACERRRADGGACVRSSEFADICADGLYCSDSANCAPRKASGAACGSHSECLSGTCYQDLCTDTAPVPSIENCGANKLDAGADGDAGDGDAADGEGG